MRPTLMYDALDKAKTLFVLSEFTNEDIGSTFPRTSSNDLYIASIAGLFVSESQLLKATLSF